MSDVPRHLGLVLDGNRRWAESEGLPSLEGHRRGSETLKKIVQAAFERGISHVTAYVFSTENWNRTVEEVNYLMNMAMTFANKELKALMKENIKVVIVGSQVGLDPKVLKVLQEVEQKSAHNTAGTLAFCFNYGGHAEIVSGVKKIVESGVSADDITEELIAQSLYHPELPPVDFMIRTSGEKRISNFMLWRMAYAELYFTDLYWPEFDTIELDKALKEYTKRKRRFGGN